VCIYSLIDRPYAVEWRGLGRLRLPKIFFFGSLWRRSRHNEPEIKDFGGSATLQTACRGGDRVSRVM